MRTFYTHTYTKAGVSQDIVLKQAPPAPHAYGLTDSNSIVQVYTEWFNTPDPVASSVTNENVVDEQVLNFGAMSMGVGHMLFVDGQQAPVSAETVKKQWVHVNNRIFLIESVGWSAISNQLQQLPQASNLNPRRGSIRGLALLDSAPKSVHSSTPGKDRVAMKLAKADAGGPTSIRTGNCFLRAFSLTLEMCFYRAAMGMESRRSFGRRRPPIPLMGARKARFGCIRR